jgi:hypothetical protein
LTVARDAATLSAVAAPQQPMRSLVLAVSASLSSFVPLAAQAQIEHSNFDNTTFANNVSMGGPNLLVAFRTAIPTSFVATRVEVWTGEGTGLNTIAIWSHDPVLNQPQAVLGSGQWRMGNTNGWQGAPLATPVPLSTGQDVWIVWGPINSSQASVQGTGAGAQPLRGSFDGGLTWNGPFQQNQWKFRMWSGPAGHVEVYGAGCAGSAGTPRLAWSGLPMAGGSFDVRLDRAPAGTVAALILGESDTTWSGLPLPLSLAPFGAGSCSLLASLATTLGTSVDPAGAAGMPIVVPANPALAGFPFFCQWFCLDLPANAFGLTFSNGGAATVGA